jgi:hypothetical protein
MQLPWTSPQGQHAVTKIDYPGTLEHITDNLWIGPVIVVAEDCYDALFRSQLLEGIR